MDDPELASLRAMLLGPERRQLDALRARIDDKEGRAEDLAEVLPRVLLQHADDPHFTRALTPPLERAITQSVQRNPAPLADALFPVMGPAIRKAVSAGLAGMVESLNRTLEYSLSLKSLRWRLEAIRTGKSFAEVVVLKTLLYRVEQVFLIDRNAGLLLQHAHVPSVAGQHADMVSGMLTAIRDFVQDSFRVSAADSLEALKVGELSVWIEPGPRALVAAVMRGTAPRDYRQNLQDTLETIHLQFGEALEQFNGDVSTLDGAKPALEALLQSQYRAAERKPRTRGAWLVFGAAAIALLVWAGFAYRTHLRRGDYLSRLATEPGLIVVSSATSGGKLVVSGMRDPLSRDPAALLDGTGLTDADVAGRWSPYYALEPPFVAARARSVLKPPDGVTLAVENGVLSAAGRPPASWVAEARQVAPLIAGVSKFDAVGAVEPQVADVVKRLESLRVLFPKGAADLVPEQEASLSTLTDLARELQSFAVASSQRFQLKIVGHADADGLEESNLPLSRARAEAVSATLVPAEVPSIQVLFEGVGSTEQIAAGADEAAKRENRCVTIRVTRFGESR